METLAADVRYALRQLRRSPGFAVTAILTLALGVGANSAVFSLVRGVLLAPLPYPQADRLVTAGVSLPDFRDLRAASRSFEDVAVWASNQYMVSAGDGGEQALGGIVSDRFFPMLGEARLGRVPRPEERDAKVVVISHGLWTRHFGADPAALGRTLRLSGEPHTVVGVMAPEFQFPGGGFELWVPLESAMAATSSQAQSRALRIFRLLARLRPGVDRAAAQAEMDAIAVRLAHEYPQTNQGVTVPLSPIAEHLVGGVRTPLLVLMGVVALVLLIACANVASLLLARARAREREVAVRAALGAGRGRLVRQLLTESLVLAGAGAAAGLVLAGWILDLLPAVTPFEIPRLVSVRIDAATLAFTALAACGTALLFGVGPAWQASSSELTPGLREGTRSAGSPRARRLRGVLTAGEIALSLVVLIGAGLLVQSLVRLTRVDLGFRAEGLVGAPVLLVGHDDRRRPQVAAEVLARLAVVPGVTAVGGGTGFPPVTPQRVIRYEVEGRDAGPGDERTAYFMAVTPGYFEALEAPIVAGRAFSEHDSAAAPEVVMLGRTLARRLFGDEPAIGRRIRLVDPERSGGWRTVVGVAGDVRYTGLGEPAGDALYAPFAQTPFPWLYVMLRAPAVHAGLAGAVTQAVRPADRGFAAFAVRPMETVVAGTVAQPRFNAALLSVFAALALLLAALGVYGVMSYSVAQRTPEIAVRMALGAGRADVVRLVVGEGLRLAAGGLALGVAGAAAATRLLRTLLFEVGATDPATFGLASAFLAAVALSACALPALRASRVTPSVALRAE